MRGVVDYEEEEIHHRRRQVATGDLVQGAGADHVIGHVVGDLV